MPKFSAARRYDRWVGRLSDVLEAAEIAEKEICHWTDNAPPVDVEIRVGRIHKEGISLQDLKNLPTRDFRDIKRVLIRVGDSSHGTTIILTQGGVKGLLNQEFPALTQEVVGSDETAVRGLFERISRVLATGSRRLTAKHIESIWILIGLGIMLAAGLISSALYTGDVAIVVSVVTAGCLLGTGIFLIPRLAPQLEVLSSDGRSKMAMYRKYVLGFMSAVIASLVAGLVLLVLERMKAG